MVKQRCVSNPKTVWKFLFYGRTFFIVALLYYIPIETVFADTTKEYTIKAAFIQNFAKYAKWPDGSFADVSSPCVLCVVGESSIKPAFQTVNGGTISTRKLMVRYAKSSKEVGQCHLLFISRTVAEPDVLTILEAVKEKPVLTIGETKKIIQQGGMVNLFIKKRRLNFEINLDVIRQQRIELSSRLLKLAVLTEKK